MGKADSRNWGSCAGESNWPITIGNEVAKLKWGKLTAEIGEAEIGKLNRMIEDAESWSNKTGHS
jgi:hypothetical protein